MADGRAIGLGLVRLARVAARSFAGTLFLLTLVGLILAGLSYYFLRAEPLYGVIAALVAVAESLAAGVFLGGKRAFVLALIEGVRTLGLGQAMVRLVFQQLQGTVVAQALERLPLRQAEQMLQETITRLVATPGEGGWLRRKIRERLLRLVQRVALARFREDEAKHGGIDLLRVRDELEHRAGDVLVEKVRGGMTLWTIAVVVVLPLTIAAQTYIVLAWLRST